MKILHFDCFSGISGDMTLAALFDAGVPVGPVQAGLTSLGLPITLTVEKIRKGGFAASRIAIAAPEETKHRHLKHVEEILAKGKLSDKQRGLALKIFHKLAYAEATAHGSTIEKVHFHEVGALDSIADITGVAIAVDLLGVDRFSSSPVPTGNGTVRCAHGLMPIPAPGTAELLKGVPLRPTTIQGELTTPTGAAILTTLVTEWTGLPEMTIEAIGHGAGTRELAEQPNILRVFIGTAPDAKGPSSDRVWLLETNIDDISAETIGYCFDHLFAAGALDVFTTAVNMKKNRHGIILSVLTPTEKIAAVESILFRETNTLGIRRYAVERNKLQRDEVEVQTPWGAIKGKVGWHDGKAWFKPEFDECSRIAKEHRLSLREVCERVSRCYHENAV